MPQKFRTKVIATGLTHDEIFTAATTMAGSPYRFVVPGSIAGEVILATAASNPTPIGVVQNAPAANEPARVRIWGKTLIAASTGLCNLRFGVYVTAGSVGTACYSGSLGIALGRWAGSTITMTNGTPSATYGEMFLVGFASCPVAGS